MKLLKTIVVASAVSLMGAVAASAATLASCAVGSGLPCEVGPNEFGANNSGNDKEDTVEAALAAALGLDSIDLMLLGKSDEGYGTSGAGQSGSWTAPDMVDYITVKAGTGYSIYDAGGATSGSWTTMGLVNGGGNQPNLSHISFWKGPSAEIPLPAAGFLLLGGLGALGIARRRKS